MCYFDILKSICLHIVLFYWFQNICIYSVIPLQKAPFMQKQSGHNKGVAFISGVASLDGGLCRGVPLYIANQNGSIHIQEHFKANYWITSVY